MVSLLLCALLAQEKGVEDLILDLKSPDKDRRRKAGWSLCFKGAAAKAALPALKEAWKDAERDVRLICAIAAARIDPAEEPALTLLTEALDAEQELWHRENAACAFVLLGRRAAPAKASLIRACQAKLPEDPGLGEATLRLWAFAATSLGNIGDREAVPALQDLAALEVKKVGNHSTAEAKQAAAEALKKLAP